MLHDGPPYPTGGIHYGTVLNKVLKDIVVRSQLIMGRRAVFRPGWDCHGLPIEQQVEKDLGKAKADLSPAEFRERCRAHALKFVDVMRAEFKRLGCLGIWDDPYLTMNRDYEATIVRQLAAFARRGLIYRDKKPVHWCVVHRTALAEAEVEYEEHTSPSIYVRFPVEGDLGAADPRLVGRPRRPGHLDHTPGPCPPTLPSSPTGAEYARCRSAKERMAAHPICWCRRGLAEGFLPPAAIDCRSRLDPDPARGFREAARHPLSHPLGSRAATTAPSAVLRAPRHLEADRPGA